MEHIHSLTAFNRPAFIRQVHTQHHKHAHHLSITVSLLEAHLASVSMAQTKRTKSTQQRLVWKLFILGLKRHSHENSID